MKYLFIEYPKCSTCQKAKKWLKSNDIEFISRDIIENTPTYEELKKWINESEYEIKKFFNTSGLLYKNLNLKDKLETMSDKEKIELLSKNGMLIKRPLLIKDDTILIGFNIKQWEETLKK